MSVAIRRGVYAALLAPRDASGAFQGDAFQRQLDGIARECVVGYAVNGATGEFPLATVDDLRTQVRMTRAASPELHILAGIGAGSVAGAVERAVAAEGEGADAVLLPMPAFFPYRQDDLRTFALAVADASPLPVLLYNLPQFTSGLRVATTIALLREHDNIVGIKDSGGSLDTVQAITDAGLPGARIIGNDSALRSALEGGVCDAVVSGVACVLPELIARIFQSEVRSNAFLAASRRLDEFIEQLSPLPTPWGLKVTSELRGFTHARYPMPLSAERTAEVAALRQWFAAWLPNALSTEIETSS